MTVQQNFSLNNIKISPLTGRIGAIIEGITLSGDLDIQTVTAINQAILDYKVVFFRGQQHLDDSQQEAFAALLGDLVQHPSSPVLSGSSYIRELDSNRPGGRADGWHTDVTFIDDYPKMTILRGVKIPDFGGDTTWANTETAYDELPEVLKNLAQNLRAIHSNKNDYLVAVETKTETEAEHQRHENKKEFEKLIKALPDMKTEHPVVRVHPETGRLGLVLGGFFERFVGLTTKESSRLYDIFQDRITRPENTVRWQWQEGDVAIWDNRATQHLAVNDYGDKHRIVRRVTLQGDIPIGVDGKASINLFKENLNQQQSDEIKTHFILTT